MCVFAFGQHVAYCMPYLGPVIMVLKLLSRQRHMALYQYVLID